MFSFHRRTLRPGRTIVLIALGTIACAAPALAQTPPAGEIESEITGSTREFLDAVNNAQEKVLRSNPGLSGEVVAKVLAHRTAGKKFASILEFKRVTGISLSDLELAMRPYVAGDETRALEANRKPVPDPSKPAGGGEAGKETPPATPGGESDGPIGSIRPGYYGVLPGYDLEKIEPTAKKAFLEAVNREMCSCGCVNETLAFCLVNDPGCPVVKARVKKVYDDTVSKPSR